MRDGEAPSYFNAIEATVLVDLLTGLLGQCEGVRPADIGVIATYRKQARRPLLDSSLVQDTLSL